MRALTLVLTSAAVLAAPPGPPPAAHQDRVQALVADLEAGDDAVRARAIDALAREGKRVAEPLKKVLGSSSSSMRGKTGVIEVWGKMKTPGKELLEDTLLRFYTTSIVTTSNALSAIAELGPRAAWTAPALQELVLRKEDRTFSEASRMLRCQAIMTLGRLGLTTRPIRSALQKQVEDEDPLVRTSGAIALWWTGSGPDEVLPALREGLKATDKILLERAIYGLGEMGPQASAALPDMEALRGKVHRETEIGIDEAVKKIRGSMPPAVPRPQGSR